VDPAWLITGPDGYEEYDLGPLITGKEAEVFLIERVAPDGRTCLLAHKRYRPRTVTQKGELQELGFQRAADFVNDRAYRHGRSFSKSRDRRAVAKKSRYGRSLVRDDWAGREFENLTRLAAAAVTVPYPVELTPDGVLMQFLGDERTAAPRLVNARLDRAGLESAWDQLVENLHRMVAARLVHADLSAYNLLWWEDRLWLIDVPQAVDLANNKWALDFLFRDLVNVTGWFAGRGITVDPEGVFDDLMRTGFPGFPGEEPV
jgi:RIO kinase 1